jgi:hypothetical protein
MTNIMQQLRLEEIRACAVNYVALYDEVINTLQPMVGDTTHHFAKRAQQQKSQAQQTTPPNQ